MNGLFLTCFAILLVGACAQTNPTGCGKRPLGAGKRSDDKVVGGTISVAGDWGWQVSMLYKGSHICGGSLVNKDWIVTAAHCVARDTVAANYRFDVGVHDRTVKENWVQNVGVSKVIYNTAYNSANFKNDVAVMKLSTSVVIDNYYIVPVCIDSTGENIANKKGAATGWGTTSSGGTLSRYLREVDLRFTTDAECRSYYSTSYDAVTMICAGDIGDGKDTCQGDSGGPLVDKKGNDWYLVGLTSWGYGCGDIGVYTRVSNYKGWIDSTINAN